MPSQGHKLYVIKEIFGPTIQGEGSQVGAVVKFIRFSVCNRWTGLEKDRAKAFCTFCDTDFAGGKKMTVSEIINTLNLLGPCRTVVISGGEPTLQLDHELLKALKLNKYTIHLETNGSKDIGDLEDFIDVIAMSPKQMLSETKLRRCDDLKILYPLEHKGISVNEFKNGFNYKNGYLQPIEDNEYKKNLEDCLYKLVELNDQRWKLSAQIHKHIGVK